MLKKITVFILFFLISNIYAQNADIDLLRDINLNRNKSLDGTFKFISDSDVPIAVGAPLLIYTVGLIQKDVKIKEKAIFIGETLLVSTFITTAMKYSFKRDRPFTTYPELEKLSDGGSYSFPSGHTSTAFATATSVSLMYPKWYVIAPSFVWASAVGYSRMDLGVHYPSDVLAGAIVGSGSAYLTYKINKWLDKYKLQKVKKKLN
jgi:membrane-associated phospholipid phosphatase